MSKPCNVCLVVTDNFSPGAARCRPCAALSRKEHRRANYDVERAKQVAYYNANREKLLVGAKQWRNENASYHSDYKRRARYGLDAAAMQALLASQNGRCAVCERILDSAKYVDHCHETGRVRGVLCPACNSGIGLLGDTLAAVERAVAYLKRSVSGQA